MTLRFEFDLNVIRISNVSHFTSSQLKNSDKMIGELIWRIPYDLRLMLDIS